MIKNKNKVIESVKLSIKSAQDWNKHYIDKKMSHPKFEVSDKVYLKFTPKRLGLKLCKSKKLSP